MVQIGFVSLIKAPVVPQPWLAARNGGGCPDQLQVKRVQREAKTLDNCRLAITAAVPCFAGALAVKMVFRCYNATALRIVQESKAGSRVKHAGKQFK